ncbi:TRAP transporter small permease [Microvirga zambiensis]|uniref:TRAP transporter small permease n=1 Tax=Microvirga zambiensis TaxID=1402137 RepID=UPI00191F8495|nr:TRAP transporter small permease [Microvirga zambiensis]
MIETVKPTHPLWRAFDWVVNACAALACLAIFSVFTSVIFDVVMRYSVSSPPPWPVPVTEYALHIAVMFGAPYVLQHRGHVVVDAFLRILPARWQAILLTVSKLLCVAGCTAFALLAWRITWVSVVMGYDDVRAISVPESVLYGPMAISFTLMSLEFFRSLFDASPEALGAAADV